MGYEKAGAVCRPQFTQLASSSLWPVPADWEQAGLARHAWPGDTEGVGSLTLFPDWFASHSP